jgi:transposase InsO family protein
MLAVMDEKIQSVLNAPHQAIDFYALHNIKIQRILTDCGSSYRSKDFAAACRHLGLKHSFTEPYRPQPTVKQNASPRPSLENGPASDLIIK